VRTFVVSWNDAAEIHDPVESDALMIPSKSASASAGFSLSASICSLIRSKCCFSTCSPTRRSVSPNLVHAHAPHIWHTITLDVMCVHRSKTLGHHGESNRRDNFGATGHCWSKGKEDCDAFMKLRCVVQRVRIPPGQGSACPGR